MSDKPTPLVMALKRAAFAEKQKQTVEKQKQQVAKKPSVEDLQAVKSLLAVHRPEDYRRTSPIFVEALLGEPSQER